MIMGFLMFQSKNLVTGGLDVLETIGKKTYDVLAEGDHGLKNTIKPNKPNLSAVSTLKLITLTLLVILSHLWK